MVFHLHVGGQVIRTTPEHPCFVQDQGWTAAGELEIGDLISTEETGGWVAVEDVLDTGQLETVYNFRVADYHTYFVGSTHWGFSVWVHNQYNGFQKLNLTQKIEYLDQQGIPGARRLLAQMQSSSRRIRTGAQFQGERAVHYYQAGKLKSIEHSIKSGRVDLLLQNHRRIELKSWTGWDFYPESMQESMLTSIENQARNYLKYRPARLRFEFQKTLPDDVLSVLQDLKLEYGHRITWKVI